MNNAYTQRKEARILVVDDEPFNLEIIGEYLDDPSYSLVFAEDGQIAWDILSQDKKFDLIVLDRMMPNMDGMELLRLVKQDESIKHLPVIMQTAAASKEQVAEGLKQGAYYYLTKPYEEDILISIVQAALGEQRRLGQLRDILEVQNVLLKTLQQATFHFRTLEQARQLAAFIASACIEPIKVVTGLAELMINAVEHGNLGITYKDKSLLNEEGKWSDEIERRLNLPEYKDKYATLEMQRTNDSVIFTISDQGKGFNPTNYMEMSADRAFDTHGRGIAMAKLFSFKRIEYQGVGNVVVAEVNDKESNSTQSL